MEAFPRLPRSAFAGRPLLPPRSRLISLRSGPSGSAVFGGACCAADAGVSVGSAPEAGRGVSPHANPTKAMKNVPPRDGIHRVGPCEGTLRLVSHGIAAGNRWQQRPIDNTPSGNSGSSCGLRLRKFSLRWVKRTVNARLKHDVCRTAATVRGRFGTEVLGSWAVGSDEGPGQVWSQGTPANASSPEGGEGL